MDERRKLNRKYIAFFTRIFNRENGDLLGHLADLTPEGMMLISEEPIYIEQDLELRMDLSGTFFEKENLDFSARSVWCLPDIDPKFWNTGFKIIELSEENKEIIQRIIAEYGMRE